MQHESPSPDVCPDFRHYDPFVPRTPKKPRPKMGAHIASLRKAAGLTQAELAKLVGETQQNVAYWELANKPPRSDVLPKMAKVLGVRVEDLLSPDATPERRGGPIGRGQKLFEAISSLPRRQQEKVFEFVQAFVDQYNRKAS